MPGQETLNRVLPLVLLLAVLTAPVPAHASSAAVATPERHATQIAIDVLNRGGNAVDAATAVAFALSVTLPDAGNIGGGGFMTLLVEGNPEFLDYRETAPAGADRDMYLDAQGNVVSDASLTGHRAVATPGTVAGLWAAHQRHGKLPWKALLQPAIDLAERGYIVAPWLVEVIDDSRDRLAEKTNFLEYFGHASVGTLFRQPELARTLTRIAEEGRDGFYRGHVARLLIAEITRGGGVLTTKDLDDYQPRWREPLTARWRDYHLLTAPLPSSGGFAIIQYLKMKDLRAGDFAGLAHNSAQFVHLKSEIEKRIFADRGQYLGDPDFVDVRLKEMLSDSYIARRAAEINPRQPSATPSVTPGLEPVHTTHFSILDRDGNAVSNTYTLNTDFGSGVVVKGAGFLLNNEMDDFSAAPGKPNYYGVVGNQANAIAPGKRMLSSMAPTIVLREGRPAMIVGAMGGSTIFTSVYQTISNVIEYDMSVESAQAATRVHHQLKPDNLITYSPATPLPEGTVKSLRALGYDVEPHAWEFGNVQLIWVAADGSVTAASDPRFAGCSAVWASAEKAVAGVRCAAPQAGAKRTTQGL